MLLGGEPTGCADVIVRDVGTTWHVIGGDLTMGIREIHPPADQPGEVHLSVLNGGTIQVDSSILTKGTAHSMLISGSGSQLTVGGVGSFLDGTVVTVEAGGTIQTTKLSVSQGSALTIRGPNSHVDASETAEFGNFGGQAFLTIADQGVFHSIGGTLASNRTADVTAAITGPGSL